MALYAAVAVAIYLIVFNNQDRILAFTAAPGTGHRVLSAILITLFVPLVAWAYGSFTRYVLKLIKLESKRSLLRPLPLEGNQHA